MLVNVAFRNVPVGIEIDRGYGDWLWGQDVRFENVSKAGVIMSNETNVYTQIGFQNIFAANMPVFAYFRDSGRTGAYKTNMQADSIANLPAPAALAIRPLPPVSQWVSVHTLGAKGSDSTDDTAAIQKRPGAAVSVRVLAARLAAVSRRLTLMVWLRAEGGTG